MGKKKPKDPQQTPQSNLSSDLFTTLFGHVSDQATTTTTSLFSDTNPFRKTTLQSNTPDSELSKKGKKRKEKNLSFDSDDVNEASSGKKAKANSSPQDEGAKGFDLGAERNDFVKKDEILTRESGLDDERKRMKNNKRKRDELEREWEFKRYGEVEEKINNVVVVGSKRKMMDDPADMMVSSEGFDDEMKLLRTVFVGNLPLKVKKKSLLSEFKKFGEVESVRIRSVPILDTKKPRKGAILSKKINDAGDSVHAYIVFKTEQSAQDSLSHNMAMIGGNHIRVDRACPPRKKLKVKGDHTPLYDNKRTVFVGNLPFDVKDEELYKLFCGISNLESSIEAVRVIRDPHLNIGKGIAYVLFKTKEAANFVVRKRNNLKLRDRELRLSHAKADATPSKRPNPSPQVSGTPAKKAAMASRTPSSISNNKTNRKANMSYQGLKANKTVVHKKSTTTRGNSEQPKLRKTKRPSVAARKAKVKGNLPKEDGSSKQAGKKRKLDSRTPDTSLRKKKFKKR